MAKFNVNRRDTEVIPSSVILGNKVNNILNYLFITWSILVIIMYFTGMNMPDYVDIIVSLVAIGITVLHTFYTMSEYKKSGVYKIHISPIPPVVLSKESNIDLLDLSKINIKF